MAKRNTIDLGDILSAAEVANIMKVDRKTIYALLKAHMIPGAAKVGRQWRILREPFFDAWLSGHFRDLSDLHNND